MATESRRRFWEIGIPLSAAWIEFARPEARREFENARGFADTLKVEAESAEKSVSGLFTAFSKGMEASSRRLELQEQLQEQLLEYLYNSELIAVGYRTQPSSSRGPVQIPEEIFFDAVGIWGDDTIEAIGFRYERVRVLDLQAAAAVPTRKIGRPSGSRKAVIQAILALATDKEFLGLPRQSQCKQVRTQLRRAGFAIDINSPPKGSGLNDSNIEKLIVEICGRKSIKAEIN